jgi:hypothetical protein
MLALVVPVNTLPIVTIAPHTCKEPGLSQRTKESLDPVIPMYVSEEYSQWIVLILFGFHSYFLAIFLAYG